MFRTPIAGIALLLAAAPAPAADGRALHDENCLSCHASLTGGDPNILYTRPDHKVTSLELTWFDDEVDAVTEYLNRNFYKFN
jgi:mono/diheme cytochrome c family protein